MSLEQLTAEYNAAIANGLYLKARRINRIIQTLETGVAPLDDAFSVVADVLNTTGADAHVSATRIFDTLKSHGYKVIKDED